MWSPGSKRTAERHFFTFLALRSCSSSSSPVLCPHLPLPSGNLSPLRAAGNHLGHLLDPPPHSWLSMVTPYAFWTRLLPSKIKASSAPRCCSTLNHSGVAVFHAGRCSCERCDPSWHSPVWTPSPSLTVQTHTHTRTLQSADAG